jgi:hypothetical protein
MDLATALSLVVGVVFGGSGFAAWILTWIQIRDARREQARTSFRNIVLTHEFMDFLGVLFDVGAFIAVADLKSGKQELEKQIDGVKDAAEKISSILFFLTEELQRQVASVLKAATEIRRALAKDDFDAVYSAKFSDKTYKLSHALKDVLGFEEIERINDSVRYRKGGESLAEKIIDSIFGGVIGAVIGIYYAIMILPSNGSYQEKLILSLIVVIIPFCLIKWWFSRRPGN